MKTAGIADLSAQLMRSLAATGSVDDAALAAALAGKRESAGRLAGPAVQVARSLGERLTIVMRGVDSLDEVRDALRGDGARAVIAWAIGAADRTDVRLAPLIEAAGEEDALTDATRALARARVTNGALVDALSCLVHLGPITAFISEDEAMPRVRARAELLLWEAGAQALTVRPLADWAFRADTLTWLSTEGLTGGLRARSLAARALAIAAAGADHAPRKTLDDAVRLLDRLVMHPEPVVWIHAARALGRICAFAPAAEVLLGRMLASEYPGRVRRAVTALGCMPSPGIDWLDGKLDELFARDDAWVAATLGPAIPHIACARRDVWEHIAHRALRPRTLPEVTYGLTWGLVALQRRDGLDALGYRFLRDARDRATKARAADAEDARLWFAITRDTAFLEDVPIEDWDVEQQLEALVTRSVHDGPHAVSAADARAAAANVEPAFARALRSARSGRSAETQGASLERLEGASRSAALALFEPLLRAAGKALIDDAPSALALARAVTEVDARAASPAFRRASLRVLGHGIDGAKKDRGRAVALAVGAVDRIAIPTGKSRHAARLPRAIGDIVWRAIDATVTGPDDAGALLAWLALASSRGPRIVTLALPGQPRLSWATLEPLVEAAESLRRYLDAARPDAATGAWAPAAAATLAALGATGSALGQEVVRLSQALRDGRADILASAAGALSQLIADPVLAVGPPVALPTVDGTVVVSKLLGRLLQKSTAHLRKRGAARPPPSGLEPGGRIGPYELIRRISGESQGLVWLVRKPPNKHRYALKIPAPKSETPRELLVAALAAEAHVLDEIECPNVALFVDHGWDGDVPYLVLEYLVGADLDDYSAARPLTLDEMKPVVEDVCRGVRELHRHGRVHRDLKPGNVFLRLEMPHGKDRWDASLRDPGVAPIANSVVIDFGTARAFRPVDANFAGTLGYCPAEQFDPTALLDERTDVFALAATVYSAMTGRFFYEERVRSAADAQRAYYTGLLMQEPLDEPAATTGLSKSVVELLRSATRASAADRVDLATFRQRFRALR